MPEPRQRDGPRLLGVGFDGAIPFVTSPGLQPLAEAIQYRVFKDFAADPKPASFARSCSLLDDRCLLGGFPKVRPWDTWEWLKSVRNGRRRKILIRAWHLLRERGCHHPMYEMIAPFVKTENLPLFAIVDGMPVREAVRYVCRLIQAPHDETHLVAGPYLKPLTQALKEHWNYKNWLFYASAAPEKLDAWLRENQHATSFFWSDYSSFDATWTDYAWDMVEGFYTKVFGGIPAELRQVLDIWRRPQGKVRCRKEEASIWYQADACNASGRDDTALANALLNGIALAMSIAAALGRCEVHEVTREHLHYASQLVRIGIVGDDSLVFCSFDVKPLTPMIVKGLESFGLSVKAQCSRDLWDVTFLGCMPYRAGGDLWWGPTIGRRLYKAFWQVDHTSHPVAWTKGVAEQMALYACVPVMSELAQRVVRLLPKSSSISAFDEEKPYASRAAATARWDAETVEWMCRRYSGLTPGSVERDIAVVGGISRLPAVVHLESFLVAVAQDDL